MDSSNSSSDSRWNRRTARQRSRKRQETPPPKRKSPSRTPSKIASRNWERWQKSLAVVSTASGSKGVVALRQRLCLVWAILLGGMGILSINLFRLQVSLGPALQEKAYFQQNQRLLPFIPRRPISDRNGQTLAIDRIVYTLYAHPKLFKISTTEVAEKLAPVLVREDLSTSNPSELLQQFSVAESGIKIADTLSEEVGDRIASLQIDGLELIRQQQRLYPQQDIAADVVGYVTPEGKGQAGVEYSQENLLQRTMPSLMFQRAGNGAWVPSQLANGFIQMDDLELRLTIDTTLQRVARDALKQHVEKFRAKRGTVIVMDAQDGSVLTLVSEPSYDPNHYYKFDLERFKNWALTDLYEPGSTFKPINVALALEAGAIQADTVVDDPGVIQIGPWSINNSDRQGRGAISITDVVKYSSNIGMVRIIQRMEPEVFYEGLRRLGLGEAVSIDLPFAATSTLKSREQFIEAAIEPATASFGQGFSITPLQLAQLHSVLANGGKLVTPHVVEGLFDHQGQSYWKLPLPEPQQVISATTANTVLKMMETVVEDGTGKASQIPGYRIAGKTGTAQKASESGGYSDSALITSFVGILSVDQPRYVVLAVVDEPREGRAGGIVAAPIVKMVMEALINLEKIPPSDPGVSTTTSTGN